MKDFIYDKKHQSEISFPLGGIGSGCIGLAGNGRLVDFELYHRPNKQTVNGLTHFSIKAENESEVLDARVLHGDTMKEFAGGILKGYHSWGYGHGASRATLAGMRHFRDTVFHGNFPVASMEFNDEDFPGQITLDAFNPFIPSLQQDSSLPAAFFEWTLENTTDSDLYYTIAFTCRNPLHGITKNTVWHQDGLYGIYFTNKEKKSSPEYGNALIAVDCRKLSDNAQACPAAGTTSSPEASWQEYWYRSEWFDDLTTFWNNFTTYGGLKNRRYKDPLPQGEMATVTARIAVPAHQKKSLRFLFTWYIPNVTKYWKTSREESEQIPQWKHYYASLFASAKETASYCFANWNRLLLNTRTFQQALYESTLPEVVLSAIQGNLAILKSSTCMRLSDGSFYTFEGANPTAGSCEGSCTHVWNYAYALAFLFPDLERSMRELEYTHSVKKNGEMNFRLMLPFKNKNLFHMSCADGQFGGLLKCYREWKLSGDTEWLRTYWPAIRKTLEFTWRKDNRFLWDPEMSGVLTGRQHHTLDMELFGPNAWLTGYYLAALKAAAEMADALGESENAKLYRSIFEKGHEYVESHLFNGRHYIQEINLKDKSVLEKFDQTDAYWNFETKEMKYQYQEGCEIDQVIAQWHANLLGLGEIFESGHLRQTLESIYQLNFHRAGDINNPCRVYTVDDEKGVMICSWAPDVYKPLIPLPYTEETMCGMEYAAACLMLMEGMEKEALEIISAIRDRYDGHKRNPWSEIECGSSYVRSLASYSLLLAYSGFHFDLTKKQIGFTPLHNGRYFFSLDGCWGTAELTDSRNIITILYGRLELQQYLTTLTNVQQVTINGEPCEYSIMKLNPENNYVKLDSELNCMKLNCELNCVKLNCELKKGDVLELK